MTDLDAQWAALCREQRAAYFAWQNAKPGEEYDKALAEYRRANKAQDDFQARHSPKQTKDR